MHCSNVIRPAVTYDILYAGEFRFTVNLNQLLGFVYPPPQATP
jgi:hypothetical protein